MKRVIVNKCHNIVDMMKYMPNHTVAYLLGIVELILIQKYYQIKIKFIN